MSASTPTPKTRADRTTTPGRTRTRKSQPPTNELDDKSVAGATIGGYEIESIVGEGGMGRVLKAHDRSLDRVVALKVLRPEDADLEARARFLREAQALARVDHPHVVGVYASGQDGELAWMALELIEGEPLSRLIRRGEIDEETALSLAAQCARGLAAVHGVGIVHRDVKPENLLLDDTGLLRIVDFGVALVEGSRGGFRTSAGVAVGTPHFMTPEQARGEPLDERVDSWGLGATLFTMLAGVPPFYVQDDEPDLEILARVLRDPAPDVRTRAPVGAETAAMVARLLSPKQEERPADLARLADELELLAEDAMLRAEDAPEAWVPADVPAATPEAMSPELEEGGGPARAILLAALVVALVGGVGFGLSSLLDEEPALPPIPVYTAPDPKPEAPVEATDPDPAPAEDPGPPPVTEAMTTAELLEAVTSSRPDAAAALALLIERQGDEVTDALAEIARGEESAARALLAGLDDESARARTAVVEAALFGGKGEVPLSAVGLLERARNVKALNALSRAAERHPRADVRRAAKRARGTIFKFDG